MNYHEVPDTLHKVKVNLHRPRVVCFSLITLVFVTQLVHSQLFALYLSFSSHKSCVYSSHIPSREARLESSLQTLQGALSHCALHVHVGYQHLRMEVIRCQPRADFRNGPQESPIGAACYRNGRHLRRGVVHISSDVSL